MNDEFFFNNININNKKEEKINAYSFYYFIKEISKKMNNNNIDSNKRMIFLNYIFISLDEKIIFDILPNINTNNYINSYKQKNIFNNLEEYENTLNKIFS